jgi:hypothetical protein
LPRFAIVILADAIFALARPEILPPVINALPVLKLVIAPRVEERLARLLI